MSERPRPMTRSEEDLRAAFRLAAQDAPATEDVLAKMRAAQTRDLFAPPRAPRSRVRQWLPIAAVAAVAIAIAVPVGFAVSDGGNGSSSSASDAFAAPGKAAAPGASSAGASSAASGEIVEPGSGGAVGGPIDTAPVNPIVPSATAPSQPTCTPAELTLALAWTKAGDRLTGVVTATNHTQVACDLNVKPAIYPLDAKGHRLSIENVVSDEGRVGPAPVLPGASATSNATWFSWCGATPSSKAEIDWGQGVATVIATGPKAPSCASSLPNTISADWFNPRS